jgi:hypothetical protein
MAANVMSSAVNVSMKFMIRYDAMYTEI